MADTNNMRMEDLFLKSLEKDLGEFKTSFLNNLSATYIDNIDKRLSPKHHVKIFMSWSGTPKFKSIFKSLEYFSPAIKAYACFKSSKTEYRKEVESCLFDAGISYLSEWSDRKNSVIEFLAFQRANQDETKQLAIIKERTNNPRTTAYAIDKADIAPRKTARKVIIEFEKYFNQS